MSKPIGLAPGIPQNAAGQDAAKYGTSNPVVLFLLERLLDKLREQTQDATGLILDVGTGEGLALERILKPGQFAAGIEYRRDKAVIASQRLTSTTMIVGDAGMLPFPDKSVKTVTSIEVLEHLPEPERAVEEMARVTSDRCVVSVPWEPWFRLGNLGRGKNISRMGNDPEHIGYFTPKSLKAMLSRHFAHVEIHTCFPWIVAVSSHDPKN